MVPGQELDPLVDYVIKGATPRPTTSWPLTTTMAQITSKWLQKFIREKGARDVAVEFFPLDVTNFAPALSRIRRPGRTPCGPPWSAMPT